MDEKEESVFAQLLFKKYEEALDRLRETRKQMALAEVDLEDCSKRIELIQFQIREQGRHEERLLKQDERK